MKFFTLSFVVVIDRWNILKEVSENPAYANPKLVELKKMILAAFQENEKTHAILFTKTKISTEALKNWVNEDPDLQRFRAMRLTGASSEDSAGTVEVLNLRVERLTGASSEDSADRIELQSGGAYGFLQ